MDAQRLDGIIWRLIGELESAKSELEHIRGKGDASVDQTEYRVWLKQDDGENVVVLSFESKAQRGLFLAMLGHTISDVTIELDTIYD